MLGWLEGRLDSGGAFWWNADGEVVLTDPHVGDAQAASDGGWTRGQLDCGDPYWWNDDGNIALVDPRA